MPELEREVLRLKFEDGLSYKEMSAVTGKSVSHVGVLLHTALKRIRDALQKSGEPDLQAAGSSK